MVKHRGKCVQMNLFFAITFRYLYPQLTFLFHEINLSFEGVVHHLQRVLVLNVFLHVIHDYTHFILKTKQIRKLV